MKPRVLALAASAAVVLSLSADNRTKTHQSIESTIDSVMIYPDRARVTRLTAPVTTAAGIHRMEIRGLPRHINSDSVRAVCRGHKDVQIFDVKVNEYVMEREQDETINRLIKKKQTREEELRTVTDKLDVLEMENDFLLGLKQKFLRTSKEKTGPPVTRQAPTVRGAREMLLFLKKSLTQNLTFRRQEEQGKRELKKKLALIKTKLAKLNTSQSQLPRKKAVNVVLSVKRPRKLRLSISYLIPRVSWRPSYDIRVMPDKKQVRFTGYGVVTQRSGEDWHNVKLAFSTAQPSIRGSLPELKPLYVRLRPPHGSKTTGRRRARPRANTRSRELRQRSAKKRPAAKVDRHTGTVVFTVPRRTDIPADGSSHRKAISGYAFPVSFAYLTIPRLSPYAYLQVVGKNTMKQPILQGNLNVFMKTDFVGAARTAAILPGEPFELTLSPNDNIRVTRSLEEKRRKGPGFLNDRSRTDFSYRIKVENYTDQHITMKVVDQLPVSQTDKVKVEAVRFSRPPTQRTKKGIVNWTFKLAAGQKEKLDLSFAVTVPQKQTPSFYNDRVSAQSSLRELDQKEQIKNIYLQRRAKGKKPMMQKKSY